MNAADTLNLQGAKLMRRLKECSGLPSPDAREFADNACLQAFGKVPSDVHKMTGEEIEALIPVVIAANAALELFVALLEVRQL